MLYNYIMIYLAVVKTFIGNCVNQGTMQEIVIFFVKTAIINLISEYVRNISNISSSAAICWLKNVLGLTANCRAICHGRLRLELRDSTPRWLRNRRSK